ncbi:MAG: RNA polymerase sigma factor (sigma-70 family) [Polaribacter sp.]|jgi:RNA polymerase sigma factor (sigma-70 family)
MPEPNTWSDEELIKAISAGGASKEKAANYLMDTYIHYLPQIAQKTGLERDQALDVFTDAIIVVMDNAAKGAFKGESKLSSYFYKIFYFKSVNLFKKNLTNRIDYKEELPELKDSAMSAAEEIEVKEDLSHLLQYLNQLGDPCKQILLDWGFWGYNMTEIAERFGLDGSDQAMNKKYRCLMKLRKLMG